MTGPELPLAQLATLLFSMIGPLGLMPIFAATTAGASRGLTLKIAVVATLVSAAAFVLAIFAGSAVMESAGTSKPSLIVAAGVILFVTALRNIFGPASSSSALVGEPTLAVALNLIAIPGVVTPVGTSVLIIFVSYFPTMGDRLAMLGIVSIILLANFVAMLFAGLFMRTVGAVALLLLGAIFGVLQAAAAVEMVVSGLRRFGMVG